jgi:hypothetical protein
VDEPAKDVKCNPCMYPPWSQATHSFDPIFPVLLRDCYNHVVASAYDAGAGVGAGVEATSCLMASMYLFALIVPESHLLI